MSRVKMVKDNGYLMSFKKLPIGPFIQNDDYNYLYIKLNDKQYYDGVNNYIDSNPCGECYQPVNIEVKITPYLGE